MIALGTHLRSTSPQSEAYWEMVARRMGEESEPGRDHGPGIGVGVALADWWVFAAGCEATRAAPVTALVLVVRRIRGWWPAAGVAMALGAAAACVWCAFGDARAAAESLRWGFWVLGVGHWVSAAGLVFAAGAAVAGRTLRCSRPPGQ